MLFSNKSILVVATHQDDESLYFGGLLSTIKNTNKILINSVTEPKKNRKDTHTRIESFKNVCNLLSCEYVLSNFQDLGETFNINSNKKMRNEIKDSIIKIVLERKIDIVITHNIDGNPNSGYNTGHSMHKLVSHSVHDAIYDLLINHNKKTELYVDGVGIKNKNFKDYNVNFEINDKKKLLDCYLPNWTPSSYSWWKNPEKFYKIEHHPENIQLFKNTQIPVIYPTQKLPDRYWLEKFISTLNGSILYIGVEKYTTIYQSLVKDKKKFETIDIKPNYHQYGSSNKHYFGNFLDLKPYYKYDNIIMYGLFGYSHAKIKDVKLIDLMHKKASKLLNKNGILVTHTNYDTIKYYADSQNYSERRDKFENVYLKDCDFKEIKIPIKLDRDLIYVCTKTNE